ncbi:MAG: Alpha-D-glucoside glucohydrolase 1 [Thermoplasmatales archaeon E-plasma]|nr:MAG: Alpha-D-glucoside glucohydrolase 1 [Thermoplasmatales archaeon E-plasma]
MQKHTISIILAVLNEVNSLPQTLEQIFNLYKNQMIRDVTDIIIIDDGSTDGTVEFINSVLNGNPIIPVKFISRNVKMGTVDAQLTGIRESNAEYVCIMDSDGQHPVAKLKEMFAAVNKNIDLIVASRYIKGGSNSWKASRGVVSRGATILAKFLFKGARRLKDPMSGFFIAKRDLVFNLESIKFGYKLLLYTLSAHPEASILEIPIKMNSREEGDSKVVSKGLDFVIKYFKEIINYKRKARKMK